MIGAIAGDIIGSVYEVRPIKTKEFPLFHRRCRFTDDTVLTVAVADAILKGRSYKQSIWEIGRRYPRAGYGGSFIRWLASPDPRPYNSYGNGSAMRVSPVGFAFSTADKVLLEAKKTAEISHNHPEGIKGAQATALSVFLARTGNDKEAIRSVITRRFGYNLDRTVDQIRPIYHFDVSCQGTVPEAIIAFLDSDSYEDAVRNAVSLGGDSDTLACITGGIAEAYYGIVPEEITTRVREILTPDLLEITEDFYRRYMNKIRSNGDTIRENEVRVNECRNASKTEGFQATGKNTVFPRDFNCPICDSPLRAAHPGRFRCSHCKSVFTINSQGRFLFE